MNRISKNKFTLAFEKLNERQKKAVLQTEGPVLVLAGPGTGKTEILAVRIGQILTQTDADANNILCLTYSNAGVNAMKKRLDELIGETSSKVEINTFHSFCNKIIADNASAAFKRKILITDAQKSMLIEKIIFDHLAKEDPSNLKPASGGKINNLARMFATLKQEDITREEIVYYATHCIDNVLPFEKKYLNKDNTLNYNGRKLKKKITYFAEKISVMFDDYCTELENRNKIEYEDMLIEAFSILVSNIDLLNTLREKYLYILVDEFQDTNKKQLAVLDLLVSGNMVPNLFVVGDDDQCIYRFQGASSLNFEWMRKKFQNNLETILLDTNYRSTPILLQESFDLISKNSDRQPEKYQPLIAGNQIYLNTESVLPSFKSFENDEQEAYTLAQSVLTHLDEGKKGAEIAILARRNADFDKIKKWLHLYKIPWQNNKNGYDLLQSYYGKSMFYLLQFVKNQDQVGLNASGYFTQFMLMKPTLNELIKAFLKSRTKNKNNLYEWLKYNAHEIEYFNSIAKSIDFLIEMRNQPISDQMIQLLNEAVFAGVEIQLTIDEKNTWEGFIKSFIETDRFKTLNSLADFLWYHDQNKISIKVESDEDCIDEDAVILSTIHGSKGLQYDIVYLIACHNKNWEDHDFKGLLKVPDLLNRYISPEADSLDDLRRLIYVACTRAKTQLHVTAHRKTNSDKDVEVSSLLEQFGKTSNVSIEFVEDFKLPVIESETYTLSADPELMGLIREKVNSFEISPTSTGVWDKCQNEFLFTQVLKMGGSFNEAPSFGIVVHNVLYRYALNKNRSEIQNFIFELIDEEFNNQRHCFHSTHIEKYKKYAQWLIPNYLQKNPIQQTPEHLEGKFHAVLSNGVKIKGKLDRIEVSGDEVKVIDYKTGRYKEKLKAFVDYTEPGSQYWRQAMMYSMLMRENFKANKLTFEFHYPEIEKGIFTFHEPEHAGFNEWLKNIWEKTNQLMFKKSCGNPDCLYCSIQLI